MEVVSIQKILVREFEPIFSRRKQSIRPKDPPRNEGVQLGKGEKSMDVRVISDTVGLSIVGGGLPAVAFASGAIHALAKGGFLQNVDYISCSEEGALAAACLVSHLLASRAEPPTSASDLNKAESAFSSDKTVQFSVAAERMMVQLREFCTVGCRCRSACCLEALLLFVSIVVIPPLLVFSAASALSSPVDSILGETLRRLLTSGLSSFSWYHAGSLVVFAPLICSCACLAYSTILASRARKMHDVQRGVLLDVPRSQAAAAAAGLGLSAAGLIVLMFIDERLLGGAPIHLHVHPVALLTLWPLARLAAHARLLPSPVCVPTISPATAAAGIAVCAFWAAARVFAGRVMGRLGSGRHTVEDAAPLLALALLVWTQRACCALLARLYRRRLRSALASSRCLGRDVASAVQQGRRSVLRGCEYGGCWRPRLCMRRGGRLVSGAARVRGRALPAHECGHGRVRTARRALYGRIAALRGEPGLVRLRCNGLFPDAGVDDPVACRCHLLLRRPPGRPEPAWPGFPLGKQDATAGRGGGAGGVVKPPSLRFHSISARCYCAIRFSSILKFLWSSSLR
jgi:hypothetical protein